MMNMIRVIIFDAYGTLISTGNGSVVASEKILALNGRADVSPHFFYKRWKELHREHILGLQSFAAEREIFALDLCKLYHEYGFCRNALEDVHIMLDTLEERIAFPETKKVLRRLIADCPVVIGSTTDTEPLLHNIARNQLSVSKIFTSESMRVYKPRPEFYLQIMNALELNAEEALFVGDSLVDDVWGPQQIGMKACWLNRKNSDVGSFAPNYEIEDLTQLFELDLF